MSLVVAINFFGAKIAVWLACDRNAAILYGEWIGACRVFLIHYGNPAFEVFAIEKLSLLLAAAGCQRKSGDDDG